MFSGRTDLNTTEGSSHGSPEHLSVVSRLFLLSIAHFFRLLTSAHRGAVSISWAEVLYAVLYVPARTHWAWQHLPLSVLVWKDLRAGMNMFVIGYLQTMSSVQYSMGKERKRFSHSFLNSMCCLHGCYFGTPAASSCSYSHSMTVLKDCLAS